MGEEKEIDRGEEKRKMERARGIKWGWGHVPPPPPPPPKKKGEY